VLNDIDVSVLLEHRKVDAVVRILEKRVLAKC